MSLHDHLLMCFNNLYVSKILYREKQSKPVIMTDGTKIAAIFKWLIQINYHNSS